MITETSQLKHATFVKVANLGVLILGRSGAGKSALALALIDNAGHGIGKVDLPATLIADDQVCLWLDQETEQVYGKPPNTIAGLLEIRGLGIVQVEYVPQYPLGLVVQISQANEIERLPGFPETCRNILGKAIPVIDISSGDVNAAAKVRACVGIIVGSNAVENDSAIR
jgi:HPr kinase/phosphorylase